jgi:hypothetical protein
LHTRIEGNPNCDRPGDKGNRPIGRCVRSDAKVPQKNAQPLHGFEPIKILAQTKSSNAKRAPKYVGEHHGKSKSRPPAHPDNTEPDRPPEQPHVPNACIWESLKESN